MGSLFDSILYRGRITIPLHGLKIPPLFGGGFDQYFVNICGKTGLSNIGSPQYLRVKDFGLRYYLLNKKLSFAKKLKERRLLSTRIYK